MGRLPHLKGAEELMRYYKPKTKVDIWTDGSCQGNPGPGGWAAILRFGEHEKQISGQEPNTTNNRMELLAAIRALHSLKRPCQVNLYTDSQYLQQGINVWIKNWKAKGWKTANNKPVKNMELWKKLEKETRRHHIYWHWVKAHNGTKENEQADGLARAASMVAG